MPGPRTTRIVVVGAGETALLAHDYFTHDSPYEVAAFSVERDYLTADRVCDLPVVAFETLEHTHPPAEYAAFVAASYTKLNRVRARLYAATRGKGYNLVSYISSRAFVGRNVQIGRNCFVMEQNVIQYGATIGDNVVLWSGNHVGHRAVVHDHCFVSSHVVIAGFCEVGEFCFLGANCSLAHNVKVAKDCLIGMGAAINADTAEGEIYPAPRAQASKVTSFRYFGVPESER